MQLLRDNLTLWTSDMQGEGEADKAEGEGWLIDRLIVFWLIDWFIVRLVNRLIG